MLSPLLLLSGHFWNLAFIIVHLRALLVFLFIWISQDMQAWFLKSMILEIVESWITEINQDPKILELTVSQSSCSLPTPSFFFLYVGCSPCQYSWNWEANWIGYSGFIMETENWAKLGRTSNFYLSALFILSEFHFWQLQPLFVYVVAVLYLFSIFLLVLNWRWILFLIGLTSAIRHSCLWWKDCWQTLSWSG